MEDAGKWTCLLEVKSGKRGSGEQVSGEMFLNIININSNSKIIFPKSRNQVLSVSKTKIETYINNEVKMGRFQNTDHRDDTNVYLSCQFDPDELGDLVSCSISHYQNCTFEQKIKDGFIVSPKIDCVDYQDRSNFTFKRPSVAV